MAKQPDWEGQELARLEFLQEALKLALSVQGQELVARLELLQEALKLALPVLRTHSKSPAKL